MFPLGLGLLIHRVPIITFLLFLACTFKYFQNDVPLNEKRLNKYLEIERTIEQSKPSQMLRFEFCQNLKNKQLDCDYFARKKYLVPKKKLKSNRVYFDLEKKLKPEELKKYKNFQDFQRYKKELKASLIPSQKEHFMLTNNNQSIETYFIAMFTHAGILHLIGNMMALLAFGIYVEAKIGPLAFLLSYLLTGFMSSFVYINFFSAPDVPLVGASGAISGIMGIFYLSFNQHYLKFWLFFKTFLLPVKYYIPILYTLGDVIIHLEANTNVAAMAHLAGSITGMLLVLTLPSLFKTPYPFIYKEELQFFNKLKNKKIDYTNLTSVLYWLKRNPINYLLREKIVNDLWVKTEKDGKISKQNYEVLRENTQRFIGRSLFYKNGKVVVKTLETIPLNFSLTPFFQEFKTDEIVKVYNLCLKCSVLSAVRIACVLLDRDIDQSLAGLLINNIKASIEILPEEDLKIILTHSKNTKIKELKHSLETKNIQESA